jgi:hypothetical protein
LPFVLRFVIHPLAVPKRGEHRKKNMIVNLSPVEFEIVEHRLAVPDALAECLSDDPEASFTHDEVYAAVLQLTKQLETTRSFDTGTLRPVEKAILIDCLEGSTFFADSEDAAASGEVSRGKLLSQQKAARKLEAKFEFAGLATSGIPAH